MSSLDLSVLLLSSLFWLVYGLGFACLRGTSAFGRVVLFLMRGDPIFGPGKKDDDRLGPGRKSTIGDLPYIVIICTKIAGRRTWQ